MKLRYLTLTVLALCATALAEPEAGISSAQATQIEYSKGHVRDGELRDEIEAELGSALVGAGETRRVKLMFEGDEPTPIAVKGALLGWENLQIERYRVADLNEAVQFAEHDREISDELRVIEFRGRDLLVISGAASEDTATVLKLRELCWPKSTQKRVDGMVRQLDSDNMYFRVSKQAIAASPFLQNHPSLKPDMMQQLANMMNVSLTTQGTKLRLDMGDIMSLDKAKDYTAVGLHSDSDGEADMEAFAAAIFNGTAGVTGSLGGGASSPAAPAAPAELSLSLSDSGDTLEIQQGGSIGLRLRGNPSTGYNWNVGDLPAGISLVSEDFQGGGASGPVGSGGSFVFEFSADALGEQVLNLDYRRPWEPAANAAETFSITIRVVEAAAPAPQQAAELDLSASDDGDTLEIKRGGTVTVRLDGNPTTGYSWNLVDASDLALSNEDFEGPGANGPTGSGGTFVFEFDASTAGTQTLSLSYHRPWESAANSADSFSVTIKVVD